MKGCFIVFQDNENNYDINFQIIELPEGETIPEEQLKLRDDVNTTLIALRVIFLDEDGKYREYFRQLLALAQLGLVGDRAHPDLANRALNSLKHEILSREGGKIKNKYMKELGKYSLLFGSFSCLFGVLSKIFLENIQILSGFLFLWTGCMLGVWLSFGTRKVTLTFDDLASLEKDLLSPCIRVVFTGLLTIVVGLLISTKVVGFQLGDLSTQLFIQDVKVALLIGIFCGLSEQVLSARVSEHAASFFEKK